jgi:eukaryotic-like serine/threonine-protein kinase
VRSRNLVNSSGDIDRRHSRAVNPLSLIEEELFLEALRFPPGERNEFIAVRCSSNPDLADRVRALLRGYNENSAYLETPPGPGPHGRSRATGVDLPRDHAPGDRIGNYLLIERIGEGGCGVVHLAEQQEPVRRRVAFKVIKLGLDTREFIARFEAERQALALMDHANIARVFDAGATAAGRPYFTMELIRGLPVTRYCDEHRLNTEQRLALFVSVCDGVQHAHQKGVVHRDLKPSNILVASEDGKPVPKIIDFGLAKALHGPLTDKTLSTRLHAFVGTPAYISPEQIERGDVDVDTRTDIYSLGALLYELLTGQPPFDRAVLERAGLDETRRLIREVDPPRPSVRVAVLSGEQRTKIAAQRGAEPSKLAVQLRSDLDWIVMRCLEKDRARRYATANALASDIRRYLEGEPVLARPPSRSYRVRKFIRRHRTPVVAATTVFISLVGGLVAARVSLAQEKAARARAVTAEQAEIVSRRNAELKAREARNAAAKSDQVAQFMKNLLGSVGPGVALGRDTNLLRSVLEDTIRRLDTELRDQPEVAAELRHTLGSVYYDLGDWAKAEALWHEAIDARRRVPNGDRLALALSLHRIGSMLWRMSNRVTESESMLQEALAIRRQVLGHDAFEVGSTLTALAEIVGSPRSSKQREALLREALVIQSRFPGYDDDEFAQTLQVLGRELRQDYRHTEAESYIRKAVELRRKLLGDFHPHVADALQDLAICLASATQHQEEASAIDRNQREARTLFREVLLINRRVRPTHAAYIKAFLAFVAQPVGDIRAEDRQLAPQIMAELERALGEDSPDLAVAQLAFASASQAERLAEARSGVEDARARIRRARESGRVVHAETATGMMQFILGSYYSGRPDLALPVAEELRAFDAAFSLDLQYGPPISRALGRIYFDLGRLTEAAALLERSARSGKTVASGARETIFIDFSYLGEIYRTQGRLADSRRVLEEGLGRRIATSEETDRAQAARTAVRGELGYTAMAEGRFLEAETLFRQSLLEYEQTAYSIWQRFRPRGRAVSGLGQSLAAQGKYEEAEGFIVRGFSELKEKQDLLYGDRTRPLRQAAEATVQFYRSWDKPEKVAEWEKRLAEL